MYKNWIFIAKARSYYLLDLDSGEIFNQLVWFRENGMNRHDLLIKNYFKDDKLYISNTRSQIIFFLDAPIAKEIPRMYNAVHWQLEITEQNLHPIPFQRNRYGRSRW